MASNLADIPIIDFSEFYTTGEEGKKKVGLAIAEACERIGFLILKGHGVDKEVIANMWRTTQEFFDLPTEEKMKYVTTDEAKYPFGYSGMGMEVLSAGKDKEKEVANQSNTAHADAASTNKPAPDLKELFSLGPSNPASGFPARIFPNYKDHCNFQRHYEAYYDALNQLANNVLEAMTYPLNLPRGFFLQYTTHHASALRALNYPELPHGCAYLPNQLRASAHTDYGTITILRSGGPGLQVSKDRDPPTWRDVPNITDADVFIINLGDLMKRWTNDHYCSTLHRVLPSHDRRQSIAFFHNLNRDAVVSNLIQNEATKYEPIVAGDFLMQKHLASLALSPTVKKQ